ncbi:MAG: hypothetical protein JRJ44_00150 [Deltaproteobacteria bacterium]|nr:hypothetical protein [Deltaproteobacteria bacterium]
MSFLKDLTRFPNEAFKYFEKYPKSARYGMVLLLTGWIWFFLTLYILLDEIPGKILVAGIGITILVFKGYNWARILCMFCNFVVVISVLCYVFYLRVSFENSILVLLSINILLFGYSGYYLFVKETSAYFKLINKKEKRAEEDA